VVCHFCSPPLTPPPLSTPAGVERGAPIWFLCAGYASTTREVAPLLAGRDWRASGRRELARTGMPRLAAAPASNETCLAHGRPQSGRRRWHAKAEPFTTTAGQQCLPSNHGGDARLHRSLSKKPEAKSRLPSLPPAGGKEGRGDDWGVVKCLARGKTQTEKQASPEGENKGRN